MRVSHRRKEVRLSQRLLPWLLCCGALSCTSYRTTDVSGIAQVSQGGVTVTYNPFTGRPSFMRVRIPTADTTPALAFVFMQQYAGLFGLDSAAADLRLVSDRTDQIGMRHLTMQQVHRGVEVYGGVYTLHLSPRGEAIVAMSSNLVPRVRAPTVQAAVGEDSARALARRQLANGVVGAARLVVYPGPRRESKARLAWVVDVTGDSLRVGAARTDTVPARHDYVIDAENGRILDVLNRLYTARNRRTHSANNGTSLPGTLRRAETAPPTGDADVDSAHTFLGNTYDYFSSTYGRDSYDGAGAALVATVHYSTNYQNAFWNGAQMVFGDGFAVEDVTAHELTHAVTERTANLEYRWQSGALNESFSDVFGAMVDREDWLMGEDLPIGAIRDLANPGAHGQPGHTSEWVATCSDNEGVHTNSGIPSKAFVNVVQAIGKEKAEAIFYRALVEYLHPQSTLEDARAAALQAAGDLYGNGETQAVTTGFAQVGLDGSFKPERRDCLPFPRTADISPLALGVLVILLLWAAARRARAVRRV